MWFHFTVAGDKFGCQYLLCFLAIVHESDHVDFFVSKCNSRLILYWYLTLQWHLLTKNWTHAELCYQSYLSCLLLWRAFEPFVLATVKWLYFAIYVVNIKAKSLSELSIHDFLGSPKTIVKISLIAQIRAVHTDQTLLGHRNVLDAQFLMKFYNNESYTLNFDNSFVEHDC